MVRSIGSVVMPRADLVDRIICLASTGGSQRGPRWFVGIKIIKSCDHPQRLCVFPRAGCWNLVRSIMASLFRRSALGVHVGRV